MSGHLDGLKTEGLKGPVN